MNPKNKIWADRFFAQPAALACNFLVRLVGRLLNRNHADHPEAVKTIAVCKIVGMGSVLLSAPMLRAIRDRYPQARILYITSVSNMEILRRFEYIDSLVVLNDRSFETLFIDLIRQLIRCWYERIDLFFDLEVYSAFTTLLATASLARNRYGFYNGRTAFRFGLNTHLVYFNDSRSITEVYLYLSAAAGCSVLNTNLVAPSVFKSDYHEAKNILMSFPNLKGKGYFIVNVNASELLLERRWPLTYFSHLIEAMIDTSAIPVILVGSPSERDYTSNVFNALSENARIMTANAAGQVSLGGTLALIQKARLMVTNDTGLYHVAASLAVPTISLWGPGSPVHYGARRCSKDVVFYSDAIYCSPCLYKIDEPACRGNNLCMKAISPAEVYRSLCCTLGERAKKEWEARLNQLYATTFEPVVDITVRRP